MRVQDGELRVGASADTDSSANADAGDPAAPANTRASAAVAARANTDKTVGIASSASAAGANTSGASLSASANAGANTGAAAAAAAADSLQLRPDARQTLLLRHEYARQMWDEIRSLQDTVSQQNAGGPPIPPPLDRASQSQGVDSAATGEINSGIRNSDSQAELTVTEPTDPERTSHCRTKPAPPVPKVSTGKRPPPTAGPPPKLAPPGLTRVAE